MNESPDIRIGDADREQALHALGEHMSVGRLTVDEYGDRSAKVATAKTRGELTEVFTDLPAPHPKFGPDWATVDQPAPSQLPATWADRPLNQRLVASIVPVFWVIGVVVGITTGLWWFMALPFIVTAVGRGLWGQDWEKEQRARRDHRRGHRRELRDR